MKILTAFSAADADLAHHEWGANCGPAALAAIMGMTLDEVRPHMSDFENKRYTNPTMMYGALQSIGRPWKLIDRVWPRHGLVRIQWRGPWSRPGVPMKARYRFTHWVACIHAASFAIFDINCMNNGTGWVSLIDWETVVVPYILKECVPGANGDWHITHSIEVERAADCLMRRAA